MNDLEFKVLFIDDDLNMQETVVSCLLENKVKVTSAFDGATGIALAKENEFDLVLQILGERRIRDLRAVDLDDARLRDPPLPAHESAVPLPEVPELAGVVPLVRSIPAMGQEVPPSLLICRVLGCVMQFHHIAP